MTESVGPKGRILVGIAGWSYPDWKGLVFPRETHFNKLEYLAGYFNTVEINTSFYSIPSLQMVEGWLKSVRQNPEFSFAVKMYKRLTHGEDTQKGRPVIIESTVRAFQEILEPLLRSGKLGAVLLQFPYRFHDSPESREYLGRVMEVLKNFRWWSKYGTVFCSGIFLPPAPRTASGFCQHRSTGSFVNLTATAVFTSPLLCYLRFHGRNAANWFAAEAGRDGRYDYDYSAEEMETYGGMVREFRRQGGTLYVIFNNHYRAAEVKNALEFLHQVTGGEGS
ncbi:MAG: DUF72 domain-containing protein [Terriglobia bacterium]